MNNVLSIQQCRELKALKIDMSKASMFWEHKIGSNYILEPNDKSHYCGMNDIPTFALQDIITMLPKKIEAVQFNQNKTFELFVDLQTNVVSYKISYYSKYPLIQFSKGQSLLNNCFLMLKWCREHKAI